jgi:hypothetical protein
MVDQATLPRGKMSSILWNAIKWQREINIEPIEAFFRCLLCSPYNIICSVHPDGFLIFWFRASNCISREKCFCEPPLNYILTFSSACNFRYCVRRGSRSVLYNAFASNLTLPSAAGLKWGIELTPIILEKCSKILI